MSRHQDLIDRVGVLCAADRRLDAALTYGSFPQGRGDEHSDVEFWLFVTPAAYPDLDPAAWCAEVAPLRHLVLNEFGAHVAFFEGLIRGEFHFAPSTDIPTVGAWPARGARVDAMLLLDRNARLRPVLESLPVTPVVDLGVEEAERVCGRFANWLLLAHHVDARGEHLRAFDALGHVTRHLLWMARLLDGRTEDWLTPSRAAESALGAERIAALEAVAAAATPRAGITAAWRAGRTWWPALTGDVPGGLFAELDAALGLE